VLQIFDQILKASDMWALGILFFMLLTGTPPFDGYDEEDLLEHIKQGKYSWPKGIQVSVQAKGLVDRMLCVDPLKRITASDALMHPWLTSPPSYAPLNAVIQRLTNFSAATLVKKAIAGLLSAAPSDDSEQLFSLFQLLDLDGDKRLDIDELGKYLLNHGFDAEDAPIIAKQMLARFAQKVYLHFVSEFLLKTSTYILFFN
jgi:calcium-dependent protein kinase